MAPKGLTQEQYLDKAVAVWGSRWDYSETIYIRSQDKVSITCREHGPFFQEAASHLKGYVGCAQCAREASSSAQRMTTEEFVAKAKKVWGDRWDYSKTEYLGAWKDIILVCPEHGEFTHRASRHLEGANGCRYCKGSRPTCTAEEWISNAREVWGDRWDYSETEYLGATKPVKIHCRQHGDFWQLPRGHVKGKVGCAECSGRTKDKDKFISQAKDVWGDRLWGYSKLKYTNAEAHVTIECPEHGDFRQMPKNHLNGKVGCLKCQRKSGKELALGDFVESVGFTIERNRRDLLEGLEVDIYIPELRIGLEFNGLYWHSEKYKEKDYHYEKFRRAEREGIRLYQIWEDDWDNKQDVVQRHIRRILGVSDAPKIPARKTQVRVLSSSEARDFLNSNHIQGFVASSVYLGLTYADSVVACAAFKRSGADYTLTRFATSATVQGGHSKLVTYFERNYEYEKLVTFADLTFGSGDLYRTTGWLEDKLLDPDYMYVVDGQRQHKFGYRLKRFRDDPELEYIGGMSESELARLNDIDRVYDAGKIRFIKTRP